MKQACCKGVMQQEVPPPFPAPSQPTCLLLVSAHAPEEMPSGPKCLLLSGGPSSPGVLHQLWLPASPAILAPSLQMAFVWDLQGATVLGPPPRARSRLRFAKSYRYLLFTFCSWEELFSSFSIALGSLQISFCPALGFFSPRNVH